MSVKERLLILDDDETMRGQMRWAFCRDYDVVEAGSRQEAVEAAEARALTVGIIDLGLPPSPFEPVEGLRAIRELLSANPLFKAVILTGLDGRDAAFRAVDLGAFDYLTKPVSVEEVRLTVRRAFSAYSLQAGNLALSEGAGWPDGFSGISTPMQEVFLKVRKLSEVNIPVLIAGEPGTGKETAARAIHRLGGRHSMPFETVDCSAGRGAAVEYELFGPPGGGRFPRKGKAETADGGTLFLKGVEGLAHGLQERLMCLLKEHSVERPSGARALVDLRVVSSAGRELKQLVRSGEFREDLAMRLGVVTLRLPPLRERAEDIYLLSLQFLKRYAREYGTALRGFDRAAVEAMKSYRWPGNVRELENRVRRAAATAKRPEITAEDLGIPADERGGPVGAPMGFAEAREAFKRKVIQEVLARNKGNVSRSATELGVSRQYLAKLIERYGIRQR